jgi:hypothetical protein
LDISENQAELIREAYRRSEKRLEAQLVVATAFDQRSYVLATVSIASAALVSTVLAQTGLSGLLAGAALFFAASALLAALSALPQPIFTAGSKAAELEQLINDDHPAVLVIYGLAINNDKYIDRNDFSAGLRVKVFGLAVTLFCIGLVLAAVALNYPTSDAGSLS